MLLVVKGCTAFEFACERFTDEELLVQSAVNPSISFEPETYVGVKPGEVYEKREAEGQEYLDEAAGTADEYYLPRATGGNERAKEPSTERRSRD